MTSKTLKVLIPLAALLLLIGVLGFSVLRKIKDQKEIPAAPAGRAAVAVEVVPVITGEIRDVRRLSGTLMASSQFVASPKTSGRLVELLVDIGDIVEKGQVIARLDDEELQQAVAQTRAEVDVAKANLAEAESAVEISRREYERFAALGERRVASESDVDNARLTLVAREAARDVAKSALSQREAAQRASEIRLGYTEIRAEWREDDQTRVVGERFADQGDLLSTNDPIVTILDIARLNAIVNVTERDYPRLHVGQKTTVRADAFPGEVYEGTILRIAPQFREASRQARVEISVANPERKLMPGMFVRVDVLLAQKAGAQLIPFSSMVTRNEVRGVFLLSEGATTVQFIPVEPGITEGDQLEILVPELKGRVVTLGQNLLGDGSAVILAGARSGS